MPIQFTFPVEIPGLISELASITEMENSKTRIRKAKKYKDMLLAKITTWWEKNSFHVWYVIKTCNKKFISDMIPVTKRKNLTGAGQLNKITYISLNWSRLRKTLFPVLPKIFIKNLWICLTNLTMLILKTSHNLMEPR